MPTHAPAIVLRTYDFSESSQIVALLTRENGLVKGLAKGSKRQSPSAIQIFTGGFELLTRGEVSFKQKPSQELAIFSGWNLEDDRHCLRADWRAQNLGFFAAECVSVSLAEHDPHPALFDALESFLSTLSDATNRPARLLVFLTTLLRETGHLPRLDADATGAPLPDVPVCAFDPASGGLTPTAAHPDWRVRRETVQALRAAAHGADLAAFDGDTLQRASRLLTAWLRYLTGQELATAKSI